MSEFTGKANAFLSTKKVTFAAIPNLKKLGLRKSFSALRTVYVENAELLGTTEPFKSIMKRRIEEEERRERIRQQEKERELQYQEKVRRAIALRRNQGIVEDRYDLANLPHTLTSITVHSCDYYASSVLDFSDFSVLQRLSIHSNCFNEVTQFTVHGIDSLRSISVDSHSLMKANCRIRDLPSLTVIRFGTECFSSSSYSVILSNRSCSSNEE